MAWWWPFGGSRGGADVAGSGDDGVSQAAPQASSEATPAAEEPRGLSAARGDVQLRPVLRAIAKPTSTRVQGGPNLVRDARRFGTGSLYESFALRMMERHAAPTPAVERRGFARSLPTLLSYEQPQPQQSAPATGEQSTGPSKIEAAIAAAESSPSSISRQTSSDADMARLRAIMAMHEAQGTRQVARRPAPPSGSDAAGASRLAPASPSEVPRSQPARRARVTEGIRLNEPPPMVEPQPPSGQPTSQQSDLPLARTATEPTAEPAAPRPLRAPARRVDRAAATPVSGEVAPDSGDDDDAAKARQAAIDRAIAAAERPSTPRSEPEEGDDDGGSIARKTPETDSPPPSPSGVPTPAPAPADVSESSHGVSSEAGASPPTVNPIQRQADPGGPSEPQALVLREPAGQEAGQQHEEAGESSPEPVERRESRATVSREQADAPQSQASNPTVDRVSDVAAPAPTSNPANSESAGSTAAVPVGPASSNSNSGPGHEVVRPVAGVPVSNDLADMPVIERRVGEGDIVSTEAGHSRPETVVPANGVTPVQRSTAAPVETPTGQTAGQAPELPRVEPRQTAPADAQRGAVGPPPVVVQRTPLSDSTVADRAAGGSEAQHQQPGSPAAPVSRTTGTPTADPTPAPTAVAPATSTSRTPGTPEAATTAAAEHSVLRNTATPASSSSDAAQGQPAETSGAERPVLDARRDEPPGTEPIELTLVARVADLHVEGAGTESASAPAAQREGAVMPAVTPANLAERASAAPAGVPVSTSTSEIATGVNASAIDRSAGAPRSTPSPAEPVTTSRETLAWSVDDTPPRVQPLRSGAAPAVTPLSSSRSLPIVSRVTADRDGASETAVAPAYAARTTPGAVRTPTLARTEAPANLTRRAPALDRLAAGRPTAQPAAGPGVISRSVDAGPPPTRREQSTLLRAPERAGTNGSAAAANGVGTHEPAPAVVSPLQRHADHSENLSPLVARTFDAGLALAQSGVADPVTTPAVSLAAPGARPLVQPGPVGARTIAEAPLRRTFSPTSLAPGAPAASGSATQRLPVVQRSAEPSGASRRAEQAEPVRGVSSQELGRSVDRRREPLPIVGSNSSPVQRAETTQDTATATEVAEVNSNEKATEFDIDEHLPKIADAVWKEFRRRLRNERERGRGRL